MPSRFSLFFFACPKKNQKRAPKTKRSACFTAQAVRKVRLAARLHSYSAYSLPLGVPYVISLRTQLYPLVNNLQGRPAIMISSFRFIIVIVCFRTAIYYLVDIIPLLLPLLLLP
jgi:hypothetical protein